MTSRVRVYQPINGTTSWWYGLIELAGLTPAPACCWFEEYAGILTMQGRWWNATLVGILSWSIQSAFLGRVPYMCGSTYIALSVVLRGTWFSLCPGGGAYVCDLPWHRVLNIDHSRVELALQLFLTSLLNVVGWLARRLEVLRKIPLSNTLSVIGCYDLWEIHIDSESHPMFAMDSRWFTIKHRLLIKHWISHYCWLLFVIKTYYQLSLQQKYCESLWTIDNYHQPSYHRSTTNNEPSLWNHYQHISSWSIIIAEA